MWHPLRLAEDFATADILTKGRTVFGVGRGYHTREVETFGAPMLDQNANRELFEEQVEIIFKAFNNERFSHKGKHYTLPPEVPYRGYQLKDLTLVPRPVNMPVECWQPIVSANAARPRLHGPARHQGRGRRRRGDDGRQGRSRATSEAAERAGKDLKLGENLMLGIYVHRRQDPRGGAARADAALRGARQDVRPARLRAGLTPEQVAAVGAARRLGRGRACPTVEHFIKLGSWFAGTPDDLDRLPEGHRGTISRAWSTSTSRSPLATPKEVMLEQFQIVAEEVMPHFRTAARPQAEAAK